MTVVHAINIISFDLKLKRLDTKNNNLFNMCVILYIFLIFAKFTLSCKV